MSGIGLTGTRCASHTSAQVGEEYTEDRDDHDVTEENRGDFIRGLSGSPTNRFDNDCLNIGGCTRKVNDDNDDDDDNDDSAERSTRAGWRTADPGRTTGRVREGCSTSARR